MKEQLHERHEFTNFRHLIDWAAREYGERNAFSYATNKGIESVSYLTLREDAYALACALQSEGIVGRHAVLVGKLSYEWVLLYYSVIMAGGVLVPLDREWAAEDLRDTAAFADASFLFTDADLADTAKTIGEGLALSAPVRYLGGEGESAVAALLSKGRRILAGDPGARDRLVSDARALSLLVFTSGTTGKGKGVMLTQQGILKDVSAVTPFVDFRDKTVGVLPPHHTYGSSVLLVGHVMIGCEVYISAGLRYVVKELSEQKPGHLVLVPLYLETFYRRILATIREKGKERLVRTLIRISNLLRRLGIDLRRRLFAEIRAAFGGELSMIISGGAPINGEILSFFEAIGISTLNGYGITECSPIIAVNRSRHVVPGSVGTVLDIDHVRIEEPNEEGEGEILVTGPNVMLGYYKDEAATSAAIGSDGYFRTGDYGRLTEDNILFITGRKKNLIILSNGKNVYPEEIENALVAVPGVQDVVVYEGQSRRGLAHNAIVAEIFPDADYLKKQGIADAEAYLRPYIEEYNRTAVPYKKVAVLRVRTEDFPKNTLRKIMRFRMDMTID